MVVPRHTECRCHHDDRRGEQFIGNDDGAEQPVDNVAALRRASAALSILFAVVPFAFALVRAFRTGNDFRYVWVALASSLGAAAVIAVGTADRRKPWAALPLTAGAFVMATVCALFAAFLLGTTAGLGMLVVGSAFGFCYAASGLFHTLTRGERI
jgi:hypothetical protein